MSKAKTPPRKKIAAVHAAQDDLAGGHSGFSSWMLVALIVALTAAVRIRLLGIPLERDEGEYAYAGQLMLRGIPPYKLAYSMKFPGIDAAYAAIMGVFGQTIIGIHFGFLLVNAAAIVLIYLLGKRLISSAAGVAACAAYALLSIGEGVLGTQAHATHFVVLAALGGTLLLLRGIESRRWPTLFWSGVLYGIAVLMKQHGSLFVAFGGLYLAWDCLARRRYAWIARIKDGAIFLCGVAAPLALTGLALWWAGVFDKFWFWTFTYAREYEHELQFSLGLQTFKDNFTDIASPNLAIWIIALAGLALIWWKKENRKAALFLISFLVFSFLALCPGFYFRRHYFVLVLPAVALLAGAAVGAARKQWPRFSWIAYASFAAAMVFSVAMQREFLFEMSPLEISRAMYLQSPFPEAIRIADYIRAHTGPNSRIAVMGSEPEIPFYAHRLSATGYIYMYGLMEPQPYAATMQNEFISDVEKAQPDYIVFVTYPSSWIQVSKVSSFTILHWWATYQPLRYKKLVGVADIIPDGQTEYRWGNFGTYQATSSSTVMIYKRTDPADDPLAGLSQADAKRAQAKLEETAQENLQAMAIAIDPSNFYAYNNLGILMDMRGAPDDALQEFQHSLIVHPDQAMAHHYMGKVLTEMHQLPEAVQEFGLALQFAPEDARVHNDLGVALYQMGDFENAAEQFDEAVRIDPAYDDAKRNLDLAHAGKKGKKI